MNKSRTHKAFINSLSGIICYFFSIAVNLIYRTIFIHTLGKEYLGIQGLLTNVLALLALVDMGIGSTLTFSMYKPLEQKDYDKVSALMQLYKKIYLWIAGIFTVFGAILIPFLNLLTASRPNISESFELIFILYLLNTVVSYLFVYKQSILHADQNSFIVTLWVNAFLIMRNLLQIFWLVTFGTFIPTLLIQLILTIISNIFISRISTKKYSYINSKTNYKIDKIELKEIFIKIRTMFLYRIGAYAINSTDNIFISKFIGLAAAGIYSNYIMLLGVAQGFTNYISTSLTSSIGNQVASESMIRVKKSFDTLYFMFFVISAVTTICFATLLNPLIELWIGSSYKLPDIVVMLMLVNYYIMMMRRLMVAYRNALGLYLHARLKPIVEAIVNLGASFILLQYFGVLGVVAGTAFGAVTVSLWIEPQVLFKYYFKSGEKKYWAKYILYSSITLGLTLIMMFIRNALYKNSLISFVLLAIMCIVLPIITIFIFFRKTNEFIDCMNKINVILFKFKRQSER